VLGVVSAGAGGGRGWRGRPGLRRVEGNAPVRAGGCGRGVREVGAVAEEPGLSFAGLLRQLRAEARLTQEELAEASGVRPRSVSDLERGVSRTAHKETAELLAGALGLAGPVPAPRHRDKKQIRRISLVKRAQRKLQRVTKRWRRPSRSSGIPGIAGSSGLPARGRCRV
jgi:transcriptional regulator with XRE-family HTH domain